MPVVEPLNGANGEKHLMFLCPGCEQYHSFRVAGSPPVWTWNGDMERPSFQPSLLVRWTHGPQHLHRVCHSYVTDGKIQFLGDCTHALAGQTVDLRQVEP